MIAFTALQPENATGNFTKLAAAGYNFGLLLRWRERALHLDADAAHRPSASPKRLKNAINGSSRMTKVPLR
jgi:hypothetical protein